MEAGNKLMLLAEILDAPLEYEIVHDNTNSFHAEFEVGEERTVLFFADQYDPGVWEVGFSENEDMGKTGRGDEFAVFATVKKLLNVFIKRHHPTQIKFDARHDQGNRAKLYQRLVSKNLPSGWRAEHEESSPGYTTFVLTKK